MELWMAKGVVQENALKGSIRTHKKRGCRKVSVLVVKAEVALFLGFRPCRDDELS